MDRRSFFKTVSATTAAASLSPLDSVVPVDPKTPQLHSPTETQLGDFKPCYQYDQVYFYNRVLTDDELEEIFAGCNPPADYTHVFDLTYKRENK